MSVLAERRAFHLGWSAGQERGEDFTPREAELELTSRLRRTPTPGELAAYQQGSVDGALGDSWRLRLKRWVPCS